MRKGGLEPPHLSVPDPKSGASASSATFARDYLNGWGFRLQAWLGKDSFRFSVFRFAVRQFSERQFSVFGFRFAERQFSVFGFRFAERQFSVYGFQFSESPLVSEVTVERVH